MLNRWLLALWTVACLQWAALWLWVLPWPPWWLSALIVLGAWAFADAGSYVFHLIVDHHVPAHRSPVAAGFQRHHGDGEGITRESWPMLFAPILPALLPCWLLFAAPAALGWLPSALALFLSVVCLAVGFGQVFHRWAHLPEACLSAPVRWAQRLGLIVSARAHRRHHAPPFGQSYAIVSGWVNPLFDRLALDRRLSALAARLGFPRVA